VLVHPQKEVVEVLVEIMVQAVPGVDVLVLEVVQEHQDLELLLRIMVVEYRYPVQVH
jgi:hypothetical protein